MVFLGGHLRHFFLGNRATAQCELHSYLLTYLLIGVIFSRNIEKDVVVVFGHVLLRTLLTKFTVRFLAYPTEH